MSSRPNYVLEGRPIETCGFRFIHALDAELLRVAQHALTTNNSNYPNECTILTVGCRGGAAARKYDLMQTIRISATVPIPASADQAVGEGVRALLESFRLTAGTACATPSAE